MDKYEQQGARLDAHDVELAELRASVNQLRVTMDRILGGQTTQGLVLDRVDRSLLEVLDFIRHQAVTAHE